MLTIIIIKVYEYLNNDMRICCVKCKPFSFQSLELNPHLTSFNLRPTSPMGSVDLSISGASKSSSSASPKNLNSPGSIHVSSGSVNKWYLFYIWLIYSHLLTVKFYCSLRKSPTPSVIQSTANVKDRSSKSFSNAAENNTTGGLIVKDAKQINNDVEKLTRGDIKVRSINCYTDLLITILISATSITGSNT